MTGQGGSQKHAVNWVLCKSVGTKSQDSVRHVKLRAFDQGMKLVLWFPKSSRLCAPQSLSQDFLHHHSSSFVAIISQGFEYGLAGAMIGNAPRSPMIV